MKVLFRTDASLDIGTGHVMRCLTLADALRERGAVCEFVCREHPANLNELIRRRAFQVHALPPTEPGKATEALGEVLPPLAPWLGTEWKTDVRQTKAALGKARGDWLIVDHYALDERWESSLRPAFDRIMVIDDLADRRHDCDLLLDQNLGRRAADYAHLVPADCTLLTGPLYALLRPDFAAWRPDSLKRRASLQVEQLLISMGGVDKDNATGKVLAALHNCPLPENCRITVVMGLHAPWLPQVRRQAAEMPRPTEVLVNVAHMAGLMANNDVAIGAAGTTAWERCCLGLPTLAMVLADNQREGAAALEAAGGILILECSDQGVPNLQEKLPLLLCRERLQAMQRACSAITDGAGVARLCSALMNTYG